MEETKAEIEAVRTLKLRYGKPLEPEIESLVQRRNDDSIIALSKHESWPVRTAALVLAREGLKAKRLNFATCSQVCMDNLEHEEVRTRLETIDLLAELCAVDRKATWNMFGGALFNIASENVHLDLEQRGEEAERKGMRETQQDTEDRDVISDPRLPIELEITRTKRYSAVNFSDFRGRVRANSSGASARIRLDSGAIVLMVHETVGWKALETSLKGLNYVIRGYGPQFVADGHLTDDIIKLFDQVLEHENRFVREVGYQLVETLARITYVGNKEEDAEGLREKVRVELYHSAAEGMCDRCAQVRFAAVLAAKALLETRCDGCLQENELVEAVLAPVLCLNRHYSAEGLRAVCQDVWRATFPTDGPKLIAKHAEGFINVYLAEMKTSRDDGAREGACYAIGEIVLKVPDAEAVVGTFAEEILECLIARFKDASWGVRAAACNASSAIVQRFTKGLLAPGTTQLYSGLVECLSDPVWFVREESAIALGVLARHYSEILLVPLIQMTQTWLQKSRTHDEAHLRHSHKCGKNHEQSHENLMMFSCCSAEANIDFSQMKRDEWQYSEGAVRLLRELALAFPAQIEACPAMAEFVNLIESLKFHAASGSNLEETAWSAIIPIAKALGKRPFKRHLDPLIPAMIRTLRGERLKAAYSAAVTCKFLREWIGEGVFRSRIESCDPTYWQTVEEHPPQSFEANVVTFRS